MARRMMPGDAAKVSKNLGKDKHLYKPPFDSSRGSGLPWSGNGDRDSRSLNINKVGLA